MAEACGPETACDSTANSHALPYLCSYDQPTGTFGFTFGFFDKDGVDITAAKYFPITDDNIEGNADNRKVCVEVVVHLIKTLRQKLRLLWQGKVNELIIAAKIPRVPPATGNCMTLADGLKTYKWILPHCASIFELFFLLLLNCSEEDRVRMREVALGALAEMGGWLMEPERTQTGKLPRNFLYSMCKKLRHEVTRLPFQRFLKHAPACGLTLRITVWGEQSRGFDKRLANAFDMVRNVRGWGGPNHKMACEVAGMKTLKDIKADKASTVSSNADDATA